MPKCAECEMQVSTLHLDPRDPPLYEEPCLCTFCTEWAIVEQIEQFEREIDLLKEQRRLLTRKRE